MAVPADTLTAIVGADAQRVSFVKVDIEGAESTITPQIAAELGRPRLLVALEVRAPIEAVLTPFLEHGFHVYDLHNDYHWIYERKVPAITEVTYRDLYQSNFADILLSRQPLRLSQTDGSSAR